MGGKVRGREGRGGKGREGSTQCRKRAAHR